jgi:hypothetical protein
MRRTQQGISLSGAMFWMAIIAFVGVLAAKLAPSYIEFASVKKMLRAMEEAGDLKGTVRDIRASFDRRNAIEDVKNVRAEDLEITKEGGEAVVTANWSVRVPMVYNISACLDFTATTAK